MMASQDIHEMPPRKKKISHTLIALTEKEKDEMKENGHFGFSTTNNSKP